SILDVHVTGVQTCAVPMFVLEATLTLEVHRHLEGEGRLEDDVHRAEVAEESEKTFKRQLLLDAIAEAEGVKVSQNELTSYLVQRSEERRGGTGSASRQYSG